jgi:hypothetical protein
MIYTGNTFAPKVHIDVYLRGDVLDTIMNRG